MTMIKIQSIKNKLCMRQCYPYTRPVLLTAMLFGSKSRSLGFSGSDVPALFASFLGSTFFGAMLKAIEVGELGGSCEMRRREMSSSGFYIPIQVPQAKTERQTEPSETPSWTIQGLEAGALTEWRGSTLISLRGEYQHVQTLFSLWGAWANGRGIRVILWDGELE